MTMWKVLRLKGDRLVKVYGPFVERATAEAIAQRAVEKHVGHTAVVMPARRSDPVPIGCQRRTS